MCFTRLRHPSRRGAKMPSTKAHDVITLATASLGLLTYARKALSPDWPSAALLCGSYIFSGLMLSADLDVNSRPYRRWGPFRFIWWPYMKLIPHRSWLSHGLVVGPMLRVAYLCAVLGLPFALLIWLGGMEGASKILRALADFFRAHIRPVALALLGLILGGATHTAFDLLGSMVSKFLGLGRLGHRRR